MNDPLIQLQEDTTAKLNAEAFFNTITVVSVRKLQIESELAITNPYQTEKNGKLGVGVLVGLPTLHVDRPNLPGPELIVVLPLRVQEQPTINMDATQGTLKSAEDVAIKLSRLLHGFQLEGLCGLYADKDTIVPNTEFPGLVTYDVRLKGTLEQPVEPKVTDAQISENNLMVTFTNTLAGAEIYYTTDGSYPSALNAVATHYTVPFTVTSGTVIRWAAYKDGYNSSNCLQATIT